MGWWGKGVMEGDPPNEAAAEIQATLLGNIDEDADEEETFERVNEALRDPNNVTRVAEAARAGYWTEYEYLQALGYMVITAGGPLSLIRDKVVAAIEADEWARTDKKRAAAMKKFKQVVNSYIDGQPQNLDSKGLVETMLGPAVLGKIDTPEK